MRLVRRAVQSARALPSRLATQWPDVCYASAGKGLPLRSNERRLARLRGREEGKRIFILGNGPSLNRTNVDQLSGDVSIASNAIFLLFDKKRYRPTYYTIEDYLVAEDRHREAAALKGPWKIFPHDVRRFIPSDDHTIYINFLRDYEGYPRFSTDFRSHVYWGGTVTFLNLQLAYYLGASKVYMIGFDHAYAKPGPTDRVEGTVVTSGATDPSHFDPRYFGAGYRWHDPQVERMEEAYRGAKTFYEARGLEIHNATAGGALEVFPRVDFDSLFS